ncbi:MAG: DinB family protein [Gemmatimonadaceae bacterium]|nr:DinB family protein [Gemmatimonadaceae bacterium]
MAKDTPEGVRLATALGHAIEGTPWHGPSVRDLLDGVSALDAAARPIAGAHSIWEIVQHLTSWCDEVRRRLHEGDVREPAAGDWPEVPSTADAARWQAAQDALVASHDALAAQLAAASVGQLDARIGDTRDAPLGSGLSARATAWGIVQHAAYHAGQIALLKRALAARET